MVSVMPAHRFLLVHDHNRGVMKLFITRSARGVLCLLLGCFALSTLAFGQNTTYSNRTTALSDADSRAEQAAERMVSLPAEKIVALLQQEPGLFLQVKKMLVRKAYEQGRLLDPEELTDEALYRLINRDENVRILVTREIVDRNYIRAKPTQEELEQQRRRQGTLSAADPTVDLKSGQSQEEAYW